MSKVLSIILIISALFFNSCIAQKQKVIKDSVKYYNAEQYKDWEFDTEHCSPKYNKKCSRDDDDIYLMKGSQRIEISKYDEVISIEKSDFTDPYVYLDIYNVKTKLINASFKYFLSSARDPIGTSKEYDENGKLIEEKNWDTPFPFSIKDLVKKFKKEYNVNIEDRKNIFQLFRYESKKKSRTPKYQVVLKTDIENKWVDYLIDGNTGKTLYIMKSSRGDDTDIFEEYLKSIGKFKGRAYKSDPATE